MMLTVRWQAIFLNWISRQEIADCNEYDLYNPDVKLASVSCRYDFSLSVAVC